MVRTSDSRSSADGSAAAPKISVVIATHNRPELLRKAIDAALGQEYAGEIECVIVFDRSEPDPGLETVPAADGPRRSVKVTTNTRSPGLAGARNSGISLSDGEFVAFCDDDDEWLPGKLNAQVALFEPGVVAAVSGIRIQYSDSTTDRVPEGSTLELNVLIRSRVMEAHPSSVVVRRHALIDQIGLVDEQIPGSFAEDYDWIIRAAKVGPIAIAPAPYVIVRWGQSLFSSNWPVIIEALDYLVDKHPEFRESRSGYGRILGQRSFALAAVGRRREAARDIVRTLVRRPLEPRAYLAVAVALRLANPERIKAWAHRRGRGI
ncbi:MAG: glycosyltransferase family 2 protein [Ilumatobacteraceae bacterium]|nr:glycosyltransferase family 2 protein [Ilumatobacteraceae bacterium]